MDPVSTPPGVDDPDEDLVAAPPPRGNDGAEADAGDVEAAPGGDPAREPVGEDELCFPDVHTFVEEFLIHVYARDHDPQGDWRWCEQWWRHPEAISRLEALWHAFEALRLEAGVGPSSWWRDHCDPAMAQLTDSRGPFAQCKAGRETRHKSPDPLPVTPAPSGLKRAFRGL